jgi:hypothetical protein
MCRRTFALVLMHTFLASKVVSALAVELEEIVVYFNNQRVSKGVMHARNEMPVTPRAGLSRSCCCAKRQAPGVRLVPMTCDTRCLCCGVPAEPTDGSATSSSTAGAAGRRRIGFLGVASLSGGSLINNTPQSVRDFAIGAQLDPVPLQVPPLQVWVCVAAAWSGL